MNKNTLGPIIQKLRKERGLTQEELGKSLGVTAQAVSNWECGGMPDAGLLPAIANCFDVSIDYLFGKCEQPKTNIEQELFLNLYHTPKEERFEKAYQYCWSIQQGLFNMEPKLFSSTFNEEICLPDSTKTASTLFFKEGLSYVRLNENVHNIFLFPMPKNGYRDNLLEPEKYEHFFSILGKPGRMKALFFIYGRKPIAFSCEKLAKQISVSAKESEEILKDFVSIKLINSLEVEFENKTEKYYKAPDYIPYIISLIPFLYTATDLINPPDCGFNNFSDDIKSIL